VVVVVVVVVVIFVLVVVVVVMVVVVVRVVVVVVVAVEVAVTIHNSAQKHKRVVNEGSISTEILIHGVDLPHYCDTYYSPHIRFLPCRNSPQCARASSLWTLHDHTQTHHTLTHEYQEYFLEGKGGHCVGLTTLPSSCVDCLEIWEPQPPGTLRACPGL